MMRDPGALELPFFQPPCCEVVRMSQAIFFSRIIVSLIFFIFGSKMVFLTRPLGIVCHFIFSIFDFFLVQVSPRFFLLYPRSGVDFGRFECFFPGPPKLQTNRRG